MMPIFKHYFFLNYLFIINLFLGFHVLYADIEKPLPITVQHYCHFLNNIAPEDPHSFYNEKIASNNGILRKGTPGSYSYSVTPGKENQIIFNISCHDIAYYIHWDAQDDDYFNDILSPVVGSFEINDNKVNKDIDNDLKSNITYFYSIKNKPIDEKISLQMNPFSWVNEMMIPFLFSNFESESTRSSSPLSEETQQDINLEKRTKEHSNQSSELSDINKPLLFSKALLVFNQNYNRLESIDKKKREFQREIQQLISNSSRTTMLQQLIDILEKAGSYQEALVAHLINNKESSNNTPLKILQTAEHIVAINERPNQIEHIGKQAEKDLQELQEYETKLSEIVTHPNENARLFDLHDHLNQVIKLKRALINQRATYAKSLRPPYEQLDDTTICSINKKKWNVIKTEILAQQTQVLISINDAWNQPEKQNFLNKANDALLEATQEVHKSPTLRNPKIITLFQRAATLFQEAANASTPNEYQKALYLSNTAISLFQEALESRQQPESTDTKTVALFQRAAELFQQATNSRELHDSNQALYSNNTATALFYTALESKKHPELRSQKAMEFFHQAAQFHEEAINTQFPQALYFNNAGTALFKAALEIQKQPELRNTEALTWFESAAMLFQKAINLIKLDHHEMALHFNNKATALFLAGLEIQKQPESRNIQVIQLFQQAVQLHEQAIALWQLDQLDKATYLNNAAANLFEAALEAQKIEPNPTIIEKFLKKAEELEKKAEDPSSFCVIS